MTRRRKLLPILLLPLLVASCNQTGEEPSDSSPNSSLSSSTPSSSVQDVIDEPKNLKEALKVLRDQEDYTLTVVSTYQGVEDFVPLTYYYTPDVLGYTSLEDESYTNIYIDDGIGVYTLNSFEGELLSGEHMSKEDGTLYDTVWDDSILPTLHNKELKFLDDVSDSDTTFVTSDKSFRLDLLRALEYDPAAILNMSEVTLSFIDDTFTIGFSLGGSDIVVTMSDVGSTTIPIYDRFISEGGTFYEPPYELQEFRRLLQTDSFINTQTTTQGTTYEVFNPNYFFSCTHGYNFLDGYVALDDSDLGLYGCYPCWITGSEPTSTSATNVTGTLEVVPYIPFYDEPDIPEFYHYPKYLDLLDELQFLKPGADSMIEIQEDPQGVCYTLTEYSLLTDFAYNFSIDQSYPLDSYVPYALTVNLELDQRDESKSVIDFYYLFVFTEDGERYQTAYIPFHYSGFNNTDIPLMEEFIQDPGAYLNPGV